jgi:hypothetical protein
MRAATTILLTHTLSAILEHVEQTPDLDPDLPGLIEFKETLIQRIQQLRNEDHLGLSGEGACAA